MSKEKGQDVPVIDVLTNVSKEIESSDFYDDTAPTKADRLLESILIVLGEIRDKLYENK